MDLSKLPNEILIKILNYCKVLKLTQVSRRFNDIIGNSSLLMSKIHLVITEKSQNSEIIKSKRKYQNILIKFNYKINQHALDIFEKIGENVKQLELVRCIVHEKDFISILESFPNLEMISIFATFLKNEALIDKEVPLMVKLKKLVFRNSSPKFLLFLQNSPNLKHINIVFPFNQHSDVNGFFKTHQNIQEIENLMIDETLNGKFYIEYLGK